MQRILRNIFVVVLVLATAGCGANFGSIYRSFETLDREGSAKTTSILIDAKQRAILAAPMPEDPEGFSSPRDVLVCAEPSPDALSAITSNFAGSFGGVFGPSAQAQTALASAFTETASQLGRRNATIQLLRDGLYRQCEAYMNGLIDKPYYEQIANKYVNAMVTLLAVEELTPSAAKAVTVSAEPGSVVSADTRVEINPPAGSTPSPNPSPQGSTGAGAAANPAPQPDAGAGAEGAAANPPPPDGPGGGAAEAEAKAPPPTVNVNLPDKGGKVETHVSAAVSTMVTWFLTKDTVDFCLRKLSEERRGNNEFRLSPEFIEICSRVIADQMSQQRELAVKGGITTAGATFGQDECSVALRSFWKPGGIGSAENQARINAEMAKVNVPGSITLLINAVERADARRKVGGALGLPNCR